MFKHFLGGTLFLSLSVLFSMSFKYSETEKKKQLRFITQQLSWVSPNYCQGNSFLHGSILWRREVGKNLLRNRRCFFVPVTLVTYCYIVFTADLFMPQWFRVTTSHLLTHSWKWRNARNECTAAIIIAHNILSFSLVFVFLLVSFHALR